MPAEQPRMLVPLYDRSGNPTWWELPKSVFDNIKVLTEETEGQHLDIRISRDGGRYIVELIGGSVTGAAKGAT